jgi:hypothetical protein
MNKEELEKGITAARTIAGELRSAAPPPLSSKIDEAIDSLQTIKRGLTGPYIDPNNLPLYSGPRVQRSNSNVSAISNVTSLGNRSRSPSFNMENFNAQAKNIAAAAQNAAASMEAAEAANIVAAKAAAAERNAAETSIPAFGLKKLPSTLATTTQKFPVLGPKTGIRLKGGSRRTHRHRNQKRRNRTSTHRRNRA